MKRLIFHIVLSVALFSVLTAVSFMLRDRAPLTNPVNETDGEGVYLSEGEGYKCVGEPIEIVEIPTAVRAGDKVFMRFKGEGYTEYEIRVYYPSGRSESDVFSPRKSDGDGVFGWEFTVPNSVSEGRLRITVLSEDSLFMTEAEIIG